MDLYIRFVFDRSRVIFLYGFLSFFHQLQFNPANPLVVSSNLSLPLLTVPPPFILHMAPRTQQLELGQDDDDVGVRLIVGLIDQPAPHLGHALSDSYRIANGQLIALRTGGDRSDATVSVVLGLVC